METLNIVVTEILLCLALAWALGFLAAWILFRKVQKEYEQEIEELEENLSYATTVNKYQEREITMQNMKIQEFEKGMGKEVDQEQERERDKKDPVDEEKRKKETINNREKLKTSKQKSNNDEEMLKLIENNLYSPKKRK
jgi:hypothetical protein